MGASRDIMGRLKIRRQTDSRSVSSDFSDVRTSDMNRQDDMMIRKKTVSNQTVAQSSSSRRNRSNKDEAYDLRKKSRKKPSQLWRGFHFWNNKKGVYSVLLVALLMSTVAGVYHVFFVEEDGDSDVVAPQSLGVNEQGNPQTEGGLPVVTPSFSMLLPAGTSIESLQIVLVSPDGNAPAYTFVDEVASVPVQVTQQETSAILSYRGVDVIAEDFQATNVLQVDDVTAYYGVNVESGTQSIIAEKEGVLLLITASRQIPDEALAGYITSLQKS